MQRMCLFLLSTFFLLCSPFDTFADKAVFRTEINAHPYRNSHSTKDRVQPGTWMELEATVKNIGTAASEAGSIYIQYAFPSPLDKKHHSVIFETERVALPSILPDEQVTITFKKKHQWPTLFNFIRDDWAMREYQVVAEVGGRVQTIGSMAVAFSAYYYKGARKNKPVEVSSINHEASELVY